MQRSETSRASLMSVLATEDDLVKIVALLKERGVSASRRVLQGRGPVLSSCQQGCVGGGSASWTLHVGVSVLTCKVAPLT